MPYNEHDYIPEKSQYKPSVQNQVKKHFIQNDYAQITPFILNMTISELSKYEKMLQTEKNDLVEFLLSRFGYYDDVIDNILDSDTRSMFYEFERDGILKTSSIEVSVPMFKKGVFGNLIKKSERNWKIKYWHWNREGIKKILSPQEEEFQDEYEKIYEDNDFLKEFSRDLRKREGTKPDGQPVE